MKIRLEHGLPRKIRYARVYFEAGSASLFFSLDGDSANWHASIGRKRRVELSDKEYTRLRANVPAVELVDDNGQMLVVRDSRGYEERWEKPQWVLTELRKPRNETEDSKVS